MLEDPTFYKQKYEKNCSQSRTGWEKKHEIQKLGGFSRRRFKTSAKNWTRIKKKSKRRYKARSF